ncbi:sigma-70 family RNA polymerase sigma factor [bacterium]|nr:sigma-70 family RNA polymerase sigma factor [bacterium]
MSSKKSNEDIVKEIKQNINTKSNMELLYTQNFPLLKKWCLPYSKIEPISDLLQEAYFGLVQAVERYDENKGTFINYLSVWVKQVLTRYLENTNGTVRLPSHTRQKILHYRHACEDLEKKGIAPSVDNLACVLGISVREVEALRKYALPMESLDAPITDSNGLTIADRIAENIDVENEVVDRMHNEELKQIWDIAAESTSSKEFQTLEMAYKKNMPLQAIAKNTGISRARVAQLRDSGLRKMRCGKALKRLREELEVVETKAYHGGSLSGFQHSHTSCEEEYIMQKEWVQAEFLQRVGAKLP